MKLYLINAILEHEKIEIFEGQDSNGQSYIGYLIDTKDSKDIYCVVPVSLENLDKFLKGEIELRYIYSNRPLDDWFIAIVDGYLSEPLELIHKISTIIDENYLPPEDLILKKKKDKKIIRLYARKTTSVKRIVTSIVISFLVGIVSSFIVTVFFTFNNPIKIFFDKIFNSKYDVIQNVCFNASYTGKGLPNVTISWSDVYSARYYKVFRRQACFNECILSERNESTFLYKELIPIVKKSQVLVPYFSRNTINNPKIIDHVQTGAYVYKIQAFGPNNTLIDEREYSWNNQFIVGADDDVNARTYIDPSFGDNIRNLEKKGNHGYTICGPYRTNVKGTAHYWWNIEWKDKDINGNPIIGWSVENDGSTKLLSFKAIPSKAECLNIY